MIDLGHGVPGRLSMSVKVFPLYKEGELGNLRLQQQPLVAGCARAGLQVPHGPLQETMKISDLMQDGSEKGGVCVEVQEFRVFI